LLWIEVKHRAHLSGVQQLESYAEHLAGEKALEKRLVFLPPAGYVFNDQEAEHRPEGLVETSWQRVGEFVQAWYRDTGDVLQGAGWIVAEFLKYLCEEDLFVSEPVTTAQLEQLRVAEAAAVSLNALIEHAGYEIDNWVRENGLLAVEQAWDIGRRREPRGWPQFWRTYGPHRLTDGGSAWLEWNLRVPEISPFSDRAHFGAGLSLRDVDPDAELWSRFDAGFERVDWDHGFPRAFKYRAAGEFLAHEYGSLSVQATALAGWVISQLDAAQEATKPFLSPQAAPGFS
jgi:hypothetical protein